MKIAVIGAGIAGMSCAWLLNAAHEVTLYERNSWLGGHSNTVETPDGVAIDTGFIVYNDVTYPNLVKLFETLSVPTAPSNMGFAVTLDKGRLEYSGSGVKGLFAQKRNLFSPRFVGMVLDLLRFYRDAPALLEAGDSAMTLGEFLAQGKYGEAFLEHHLLPMGAAIWSMTPKEMLDFPAKSFVRFFVNHGLFRLKNRIPWRTVKGGSREYVKRLLAPLQGKIHQTEVVRVLRDANGVVVTDLNGLEKRYDAVVMACHGDEALALMADASPQERAVLAKFSYSQNRAILHSDDSVMPKRRNVWAAWNYIAETGKEAGRVALSYWMNRLQPLAGTTQWFVSLNPLHEPAKEKVVAEFNYTHPLFTKATIDAQQEIRTIQGQNRVWFCGAHLGYGFHEDGLSSGLAVAEALGGLTRPWQCTEMSPAGENATPAMPPVPQDEAA